MNKIANNSGFTLTARTSKLDPDYTHPTYGDHYRRYTLESVITPKTLYL
ncbi:MAG: hypothetical protein LWW97_03435 [Deltaproteobacteria bacterium]|nr:hypothetical protein [Deltaproteobacteria bacterium]